jgi:predicted nucleic acid-binding Zn ribbon protein
MLKMTDHDVLVRFHRALGLGAIYPVKPRKTSTGQRAKRAWSWKASGEDAAIVAVLLMDQLCARRQKAARAFLDTLAARTKTCVVCGTPFLASRSNAVVCSRRCRDKLNHEQAGARYRELRAHGFSPDHARRLRYSPRSGGCVNSA